MRTFSIDRPELIQMMVDSIEEEYGNKAVDKVDLELLADVTMDNIDMVIEQAIITSVELAGRSKIKRKMKSIGGHK